VHVRKRSLTPYAISLFFVLFLACLIPFQSAAAKEKGVIEGDNLNIRSAPSLNASVVGQLNSGDQIQINSKSGDGYSFTFQNRTAYVHSNFVKVVNGTTAAASDIKVFVNGERLSLPIAVPVKDSRVLVPFRKIGEALGIDVNWLSASRQVRAIDQGKEVLFTINSTNTLVDGQTIVTRPAPYIEKGHTVIPLRFFAETFGADVKWDASARTVTINRSTGQDEINVTHTVNVDELELYEEPDISSTMLGFLRKGSGVEVVSAYGVNWIKLRYNGHEGYIFVGDRGYEEVLKDAALLGKVHANVLNVRSKPSTDGKAIGSLKNGETVQILDFDGSWAKIEFDGVTGYVHSYYLSIFKTGSSFSSLSEPIFETDNERNTLIWEKQGSVKTTHRLIAGGVEITTSANEAGAYSGKHPGIKQVQAINTSSGVKLQVKLEDGFHFVVRHSSNDVRVTILKSGLRGKRIVIDAGHGAQDPGAVGPTGLYEKSVNLDVSERLAKLLRNDGAEVTMTRSEDTFLSLAERVEFARDNEADVFISVHADSFKSTTQGSTTFYHSGVNPSWEQSKQLAEIAIDNLVTNLGTVDRGAKDKSLHVIRETDMPAILVELAFLSNPKEEAQLKDAEFRQKAAEALYQSLQEFYE
jgi:N-acetylmuramoyl-L-alanine amidase